MPLATCKLSTLVRDLYGLGFINLWVYFVCLKIQQPIKTSAKNSVVNQHHHTCLAEVTFRCLNNILPSNFRKYCMNK